MSNLHSEYLRVIDRLQTESRALSSDPVKNGQRLVEIQQKLNDVNVIDGKRIFFPASGKGYEACKVGIEHSKTLVRVSNKELTAAEGYLEIVDARDGEPKPVVAKVLKVLLFCCEHGLGYQVSHYLSEEIKKIKIFRPIKKLKWPAAKPLSKINALCEYLTRQLLMPFNRRLKLQV